MGVNPLLIARYLSHICRRLSLLCPHLPPKKGPIALQGLWKRGVSASFGEGGGGGLAEYRAIRGIANLPTALPFRGNYRVSMAALFGPAKALLLRRVFAEIASCLTDEGPSTELKDPRRPSPRKWSS